MMWAMVVLEHVANINGVEKDLFFQSMQTTSTIKGMGDVTITKGYL
ncbi:MAG: hypothetical protein ACLTE2_10150 [Eubacteriales bacterium]